MRKLLFYYIIFLTFSSCNFFQPKSTIIRIKGSDTMFEFTEMLAREYMKNNPNVAIYVYGGGSKEGIRALAKKEVDIAMASRLLTPEEIKVLAEDNQTIGVSYLIAKDAISIFINPANSIKNFSINDLKKIFTCKINNWKELGGEDHEIKLYIRNPNSGTYFYFQQIVLNGEKYCLSAISETTTNKLIEQIEKDKYAIGYGGIGFVGKIEHAKIEGIEPTEENVRNDLYPLSRYLYFYTLKNPDGEVKRFIDWVLSRSVQSLIKKTGYVPIWNVTF